MNRPNHGLLGLVALATLAAATLGAAAVASARPAPPAMTTPRSDRGDRDRDARPQARRQDDRRSEARRDDRRPAARRAEARRPSPPRGAVAFRHAHADYHFLRGTFYRWNHGVYVVTRAPLGAALQRVPAGFTRVVVAGHRYAVLGDLWLSWSAPLRAWVVVDAPLHAPHYRRLSAR